ncbi:myricetin 7/4'-O-methyltransferase 2-like [Nicotiana tabacum]|uniref:Myricetin 7/4'-O-methyltransferase 2-like n=1 Tax=Nicotiana tabacum TaxID=4097 RepID=A0AC58UCC7_TOBAC
MASDSRLISNVLITECKHVFEGLTSLVDVGGGTGTVAIGNFKGSGNVEFVGGSMRRFLMLMQSYSSITLLNYMHRRCETIRSSKGYLQRTKMDWERLFTDAGFNEYKITPTLGTRSLIEIYP